MQVYSVFIVVVAGGDDGDGGEKESLCEIAKDIWRIAQVLLSVSRQQKK